MKYWLSIEQQGASREGFRARHRKIETGTARKRHSCCHFCRHLRRHSLLLSLALLLYRQRMDRKTSAVGVT